MARALILKLNGWPKTFDERIKALAASVDELVIIRPKPIAKADRLAELDGVVVYDLLPRRGSFVKPGWLKPVIFPLHVLQAILVMTYLFIQGKLPSVIHALDYALGGLAGAIARHIFSVPLVVSVRGLKEPRYKTLAEQEQALSSSVSYIILRTMTRFVLTSADHVVTKAEYQVDFVKETFSVDPGFTTVPTGVDFDVFDPARTTHVGSMTELLDVPDDGLSSDDKVILYLAKLLPEKGPDKVLQLVDAKDNELPDNVMFAFVGEFRDATFERQFRKLERGISHRVLLHPERVPFKDVPDFLNVADAVVLLSESGTEGVPRILQESCAMQTPIIGSDVTGIAGAFEGLPGCYLIDRENPQEFARAVTQATTDPPEMPRSIFANQFDMYRNYAEYAAVYTDLTESDD